MQINEPLQSLCPGPRGAVLAVLARTYAPLTGRAVAGLTSPKISLRAVQLALNNLVIHGLVNRQVAGTAHMFELNRDHIFSPIIESAVNVRGMLARKLCTEIDGWLEKPEAVWLFGSVARGNDSLRSDIDLCMLRTATEAAEDDIWDKQLTILADQVYAWTGNQAEFLTLSIDEVTALKISDERIYAELREDALPIFGLSPQEILR
jgi:hypothetical protein